MTEKSKKDKIFDEIYELMREKEVNPYMEAELADKLHPKTILIIFVRFLWTIPFAYAVYCVLTLLFFLIKYYLVVLKGYPLQEWTWFFNLVYEVLISYMNWYAKTISGDVNIRLDNVWLCYFVLYPILGYFLYHPVRAKLKVFVEEVLGEEFSDDLYW